MLCGLLTIVSDRCGCARDLVNSGAGWSFDPRDSAGFARILEKVAGKPLEDLRARRKLWLGGGRDGQIHRYEAESKMCYTILNLG